MRSLTADRRSLLLRILRYVRPYRRAVLGALALTVLQAAIAVIPVLAVKVLIDRLTRHTLRFSSLLLPIGGALGTAVLAAAVGIAVAYLVEYVSEGIVFDLREELFNHLIEHGSAFYTRNRAGDLLSRMLGDIGGV
ncbi:MAG TPA: ABC transporter transmembrane domain-containing protein, partial [Solirubrobacteraceae bacterium]|nr:ABC transporter transmembrane domain-containing protein [Solirubrobacteraceae bacterium]